MNRPESRHMYYVELAAYYESILEHKARMEVLEAKTKIYKRVGLDTTDMDTEYGVAAQQLQFCKDAIAELEQDVYESMKSQTYDIEEW